MPSMREFASHFHAHLTRATGMLGLNFPKEEEKMINHHYDDGKLIKKVFQAFLYIFLYFIRAVFTSTTDPRALIN